MKKIKPRDENCTSFRAEAKLLMTDDVLNNPGGLVKFVVPYCNSEGEYLGQVTEDDNEYDPYYRVYNRKYVLKFHKIYVQQYIFGLRGYNTQ